MHYLTYVFSPKDTNIKKQVAKALKPFGEDFEVKPWKRYLESAEILAMAKWYRLRKTALRRLAKEMQDWNGATGGVDRKGLFAVVTFNPEAKWDWYEIGGRWDGFLPNNVMSARSLLSSHKLRKLLPHDFLTPDSEWHTREAYVARDWLHGRLRRKSEQRWLKELREALRTYADHLVVCVDIHT